MAGETVVIQRVDDRDSEILRRLAAIDLVPGTRVTVVERGAKALTVDLEGNILTVEEELAGRVFVD